MTTNHKDLALQLFFRNIALIGTIEKLISDQHIPVIITRVKKYILYYSSKKLNYCIVAVSLYTKIKSITRDNRIAINTIHWQALGQT